MGCVSSNLLNHDEEFTQLGSSSLSQHIVSLTSTTYGLLSLDPPPQNSNPTTPPPPTTPPTRFTLSEPKSLWSEPRSLWSEPKFQPADVINSWELMAGLDNHNNSESFRFFKNLNNNKENSNPNKPNTSANDHVFVLDKFEKLCPPNGENKVVLYTTTLRGVRKTFEQCNAVRAVLQSLGVLFTERDISMDRGFREELRELMEGKEMVPPSFDTQTIERMEVLILGGLKWRMRSITPFSFISYFISLFKLKDPSLKQAIKARATEIIFKAQNEIKLLKFRPSIIAASALLSAAHELLPLQYPCFRKATSNCSYVNKENLLQCYNAMQDIVIDGYESVFDMVSSSVTPVNVLDQQFSSTESEKTNGTITSSSTSRSERDIKKRRIIGYCDNLTVQISRIQQC